ncbi:hypothetical protein CFR78_08380 [Komagataeibacter rhaeticus]|uniref:Uncharacterized protein n=1 Tax=Komagataeibacter rhaeticus TaxID=215221 RepID=A0A181CAZ5_9PROT|nr:hypothetical protein [Komagataeibacter rhaeticus]ATU72578.1 hypothetical protein CT154_06735 [Komagataeibacter xylinus]EGG74568.1 hypothetical protein SXCC_04672 [Gluconacetobacter sp. SXCC-1]KDU94608.1 hypothetical protein GLUCORHAEAF1_12945 [Komagataeibacter rhaeticus AF1]MBL7238605.1 hypothetical protein [Komagataeibacter rhaeticus]PYD53638.1 hypothetical protein CFR78_08380 [Komagataeibacter rhaeticus]
MTFFQHRSWRMTNHDSKRQIVLKILSDGKARSVKEIGDLFPELGTYHARLALQALRNQGLVTVEDAPQANDGRKRKVWRLVNSCS